MDKQRVLDFQEAVYAHFKKNRRVLPWRYETDPYKILVSEVMLQQTQVVRVIPKYQEWLEKFPTVESLAKAPLRELLVAWQGLGYNRRGKYLKLAAEKMTKDTRYNFMLRHPEQAKRVEGSQTTQVIRWNEMFRLRPNVRQDSAQHDREITQQTIALLQELPSIGLATAAAIVTYAFNKPTIFIETNIRAVYLYCFFKKESHVSDKQITDLVEKTLDFTNPRDWYYALTDYGNFLKTKEKFKNNQSKHYVKQPKFEGSRRQIRGKILKILLKTGPSSTAYIKTTLSDERTEEVVKDLEKERLIAMEKGVYRIL